MDKSMKDLSHVKAGSKKPAPEEVKGGLDPRDIIGRFRSKQDIYDYLSMHSKQ